MDQDELDIYLDLAREADLMGDMRTADHLDKMIKLALSGKPPKSFGTDDVVAPVGRSKKTAPGAAAEASPDSAKAEALLGGPTTTKTTSAPKPTNARNIAGLQAYLKMKNVALPAGSYVENRGVMWLVKAKDGTPIGTVDKKSLENFNLKRTTQPSRSTTDTSSGGSRGRGGDSGGDAAAAAAASARGTGKSRSEATGVGGDIRQNVTVKGGGSGVADAAALLVLDRIMNPPAAQRPQQNRRTNSSTSRNRDKVIDELNKEIDELNAKLEAANRTGDVDVKVKVENEIDALDTARREVADGPGPRPGEPIPPTGTPRKKWWDSLKIIAPIIGIPIIAWYLGRESNVDEGGDTILPTVPTPTDDRRLNQAPLSARDKAGQMRNYRQAQEWIETYIRPNPKVKTAQEVWVLANRAFPGNASMVNQIVALAKGEGYRDLTPIPEL